MHWRRIACWILTVCLLTAALPAMSESTPTLDTWMELGDYLRDCTQARAEEIRFRLAEPEALTMEAKQLRQTILQMTPLMSRMYATISYGNDEVSVVITPVYRSGVRMLDAWRSGDKSALSRQERAALDEAETLVKRLRSKHDDRMVLERAIFDELCARLTFMEVRDWKSDEDAAGVGAAYALTYGKANCQGYSDAFYLLASMAGFEVGFQNGYNDGVLHTWNTIKLDRQWYVVDVTLADSAGDLVAPEIGAYALFNAGRDRCKGILSWVPACETANIVNTSDGNYFFHAGIPGFGSVYDDLDAMARYCYSARAHDGEREQWILLIGHGEELPIDGINAAMKRATSRHSRATRWRFWGWPCGGAQCILLRWDAF